MKHILLFFILLFFTLQTSNLIADQNTRNAYDNIDQISITFKIDKSISEVKFREAIEKEFNEISKVKKQILNYDSSRIRSDGTLVVYVPSASFSELYKIIVLMEKIKNIKYATPNYHVEPL